NPLGVAFTPDGSRAYVTSQDASTVSVIDVATNAVVGDPIAVGTNPVAVAITPDGSRVYVANIFGSSVSVIAIEVAPTLSGTPPAGVLGQLYSHAFTTAGQPDPAVTVTAGVLPAGLTLTEAGVLSGTPTAAGSFTFTVTASNGIGESAVLPVTLVVTDSAPPSTGSLGSLEGFGS
ncbi:putative Ig domain protein, partial [Rhodococcus erythropolis SK121]